jgi:undecaprenyl-diphosphatase
MNASGGLEVSERFLVRPLRGVWLGVLLLGVVALMAIFVPAEPLAIDRWWSEAMRDIQGLLLKEIALVFNALGRGLGWALSLAAVAVMLVVARRWLALVAFALTESLTSLSSVLLKGLVGRPRPPDGLVHPVGSAFPSGHAAYAGATCVALVLLFTRPGPRRRLWSVIAIAAIVGMAWSRTYLQVHWLSDVVAGSLLGIGLSLLVFGSAQWCGEERREAGVTDRRRGRADRLHRDSFTDGRLQARRLSHSERFDVERRIAQSIRFARRRAASQTYHIVD